MIPNSPEVGTAGSPGAVSRARRYWLLGTAIGVPLAFAALVIVFFEWNMLKPPLERLLSAGVGRPVHIDGDLQVDLSWTPELTLNGVRVDNPDWAPEPSLATIERVVARLRLLPALVGNYIFPSIEVSSPTVAAFREASGRASWGEGNSESARLPEIHALTIDNGRIALVDDVRGVNFVGSFSSEETGNDGDAAFELEGNGTLNARPFLLRVTGESLLYADASEPYGFAAEIREGDTEIAASGTLGGAFDLGAIDAMVTFSGNDLADLYFLTGLALPNTPPYELSGAFRRSDTQYSFTDFSGMVGDSDARGTLSVDGSGERPFLEADVASTQLDFDDIATVFGAPPQVEDGETASPEQAAAEARLAASDRLLPDAPLQLNRIRGMDANAMFTAESVISETLPIRGISLSLGLENGVLTLDPVTVVLTQGSVAGNARIDAQGEIPLAETDFTLREARLEDFFQLDGDEVALEGELRARFQLAGEGFSVAEVASNADGKVGLIAPGGEIRRAFAELLGINVARGLGLLLADDQSTTELRCAIAQFNGENGILTAEALALDSGPVLALGSGTVNLATETIALRFEGHPKEPRLIRLMSPVTVTGTLRSPKIGVEPGPAIAQVAVAGALATLLSPLAGIIPFATPGLEEDADCNALLNAAIGGPAETNEPPATAPADN